MEKLLTTAAMAAALLMTINLARADDVDHAEEARNHGYQTAALEVVCGDMLTVTDRKLRAKCMH